MTYSKKNLRDEIEDGAKARGVEGRAMHHASAALGLSQAGLSYQRFDPNHHQTAGHSHSEQEEICVIIRGSGRVKLDDEIIDVSEYDAVRVPPGVMRAIEAGPQGLEMIVVGAPQTGNDKPTIDPEWWSE